MRGPLGDTMRVHRMRWAPWARGPGRPSLLSPLCLSRSHAFLAWDKQIMSKGGGNLVRALSKPAGEAHRALGLSKTGEILLTTVKVFLHRTRGASPRRPLPSSLGTGSPTRG